MDKIQNFRCPRIVFGNHAIEKIADEIKSQNSKKIMIITSKSNRPNAQKIRDLLSDFEVEIFDAVEPEPSLDTLSKCIDALKNGGHDTVIGLGGGSVLDVAKAAAVLCKNPGTPHDYLGIDKIKNAGLKKILIPTTSGTGSEVTHVSVFLDENKKKVVMYSPYLFADLALIDPVLTLSLPKKFTAETGMDALGHAIESYISLNASPLTESLSLKAIELIGKSLQLAVEDGSNLEARYNMSLAATAAGIAFLNAGCNLGHALALAVGGKYNISHGLSVALMMPYAVEFNAQAAEEKLKVVCGLLGEKRGEKKSKKKKSAAETIRDLMESIGIDGHLTNYGFKAEDIKELAETTMAASRLLVNNPRKVTLEDVVRLFERVK